ncbi:hypothetical protein [uncultured Phascolarctobacterium sp.]|uniref:hypothetical protein n=1 Tax=uncultured Phascolarctobacterium sp. TaxID=512296 RepID=UPI00260D8615|nr:hypothetical protein [uncultured Phascolarctobacterium sp.]
MINNIDNKNIVAEVAGIAIPQYPVKASEVMAIFSKATKGQDIDDLYAKVDKEVKSVTRGLIRAIEELQGEYIDRAEMYRLLNLDVNQAKTETEKLVCACLAEYYGSYFDVANTTILSLEEIPELFAEYRGREIAKHNKALGNLITSGFISYGYQVFYIPVDRKRIYFVEPVCIEEERDYNTDVSDNSTAFVDLTECLWREIKTNVYIQENSIEEYLNNHSNKEIADHICTALWNFKSNTDKIVKVKTIAAYI